MTTDEDSSFWGNSLDSYLIEPDNSQLIVGLNLIRSLLEILSLAKSDIYRHSDVSSKTCPGKLFPWDNFIRSL